MTVEELASALLGIREQLPDKAQGVAAIIFGSRYKAHIKRGWPSKIVKLAGIGENSGYVTDIYKGMKVAEFLPMMQREEEDA